MACPGSVFAGYQFSSVVTGLPIDAVLYVTVMGMDFGISRIIIRTWPSSGISYCVSRPNVGFVRPETPSFICSESWMPESCGYCF